MGGVIDVSEVERSIAQQRADEIYGLQERVRQLEKLNATLAAEIDRMRPVVEATVREVRRDDDRFSWSNLQDAVNAYEESQPK